AVLWLLEKESQRCAGSDARFPRLQLLAEQGQRLQRRLRQRRNGQGIHHLARIPPTIRTLSDLGRLGCDNRPGLSRVAQRTIDHCKRLKAYHEKQEKSRATSDRSDSGSGRFDRWHDCFFALSGTSYCASCWSKL